MTANGDPESVRTSTPAGTNWKCVDYPAEPPGDPVGMIIVTSAEGDWEEWDDFLIEPWGQE